ncbi:cysteine synthase A [Raoultibacter phocaeensis]|uniref:cysteine synthase A n=1 Tax=Raoultibacter phocaeensis TaxID=2479841 RepID=UPI00111A37F1|nr:cysteine synthase A [Raoultibacter phocaeensis]
MKASSIESLIGNTPLLDISGIEGQNANATILAKFEAANPGGSIKDRIAKAMLDEAEAAGLIAPGGRIIEPTSGNTGIGLAMLAAARGYRLTLVMPETMSIERRKLLAVYGAELVLTEGAKGMPGAIAKAEELLEAEPEAFMPRQFENPANPRVHYETTGPEIWSDAGGAVNVFVAGVGTGGTISGAGGFLKEKNPDLLIIAVEPEESPVLSGGSSGPHKIQGIGAGFVPDTLDTSIYDEIIRISTADAFATQAELARKLGVFVGVSSGAATAAARIVAQRPEFAGKTIATVLPDTGERYLSMIQTD